MIAINGAGGAVGQPVGQTATVNGNVKANNDPIIFKKEEVIQDSSMSTPYSNIARFVQGNPEPKTGLARDITINYVKDLLEKDKSYNAAMKEIVLSCVDKASNDNKIAVLEKGLAFLETEKQLSALVTEGKLTLEDARKILNQSLDFGCKPSFKLETVNEFNKTLSNEDNKNENITGEKIKQQSNALFGEIKENISSVIQKTDATQGQTVAKTPPDSGESKQPEPVPAGNTGAKKTSALGNVTPATNGGGSSEISNIPNGNQVENVPVPASNPPVCDKKNKQLLGQALAVSGGNADSQQADFQQTLDEIIKDFPKDLQNFIMNAVDQASTPAEKQIILDKCKACANCKTALENTLKSLPQNKSTSETKDELLKLLNDYFKDFNSSAETLNAISKLLTRNTVTEATVLITFLRQNSPKAFERIENFSKAFQMFIMEVVNKASTPESKAETLNKYVACANCHMAIESLALKINLTEKEGDALLDQLYAYFDQPECSAETLNTISNLLKSNTVTNAQEATVLITFLIQNSSKAFEGIKNFSKGLQMFIMGAVNQASTLAEKQTTLNKGIAYANCYVAFESLWKQGKLTQNQENKLLKPLNDYFNQSNSSAETFENISNLLNPEYVKTAQDAKMVILCATNNISEAFEGIKNLPKDIKKSLMDVINKASTLASKVETLKKGIVYANCHVAIESLWKQGKLTQNQENKLLGQLNDYLNQPEFSAETLNSYINTQIEELTSKQNFIASAAKAASTPEEICKEILKATDSSSFKHRQMIIDIVNKHGGIDSTVLEALLKDSNCTCGVKVALLMSDKLSMGQKMAILKEKDERNGGIEALMHYCLEHKNLEVMHKFLIYYEENWLPYIDIEDNTPDWDKCKKYNETLYSQKFILETCLSCMHNGGCSKESFIKALQDKRDKDFEKIHDNLLSKVHINTLIDCIKGDDDWDSVKSIVKVNQDMYEQFFYQYKNNVEYYRKPKNFVNVFNVAGKFAIAGNWQSYYSRFFEPSTFTKEERTKIVEKFKEVFKSELSSNDALKGMIAEFEYRSIDKDILGIAESGKHNSFERRKMISDELNKLENGAIISTSALLKILENSKCTCDVKVALLLSDKLSMSQKITVLGDKNNGGIEALKQYCKEHKVDLSFLKLPEGSGFTH